MAKFILEANKKECVLGINSFDKPTELIGKNAWVQLVINLLFLKKGTYPSIPEMGIGIQYYEYEFIDEVKEKLEAEIKEQIRKYLPDIPIDSVILSTTESAGTFILIIAITFVVNGASDSAVIASASSPNIINFAVNM